ncbi:MAG: ABC transporter substrate-binding protein [Betaproteobacteria bacterium]|nr:ABC transporter substrate-binding protein [Betaproteobacteria bacterium]
MNIPHPAAPRESLSRRWRIRSAVTLISALAIGVTTYASAESMPAPSPNATLTIGIGVDLDTVDPAQQTTTTVQNVIDYGLQTLVAFDTQGKIEPLLATSWATSKDGLTLTFQLRRGVKFQDGTPFNADAVVFCLDRLISGKVRVPIGAGFKSMKSIEAVNPTTVAIHLKHPDPNLVPNLTTTMASIFSPTSATKDGNTPTNIVHPVGTGPYQFTRWSKGSEVVYTRVDDYWGPKPYYKTVDFKIIPEANSREAGLLAGQLDVVMNPPVTDLTSLSSNPAVKVLKAPSDRAVFIAINTAKPPFNNEKVRQALNYAVDKDAIIKNVMFDSVNLMDSPFPSSLSGYCKVGAYRYDPDKARQLLAEAGVKNLKITLGSPTGRYIQDIQFAQAISGYLRKVGIDADVRTMDWPSYVSAILNKNGPFDLHMLGWAPGALDGQTQLQMFTTDTIPPKGLNSSFFSDPTVDKLASEAGLNLDEKTRNQQLCRIQKEVWQQAPWIFLWSQTLILAYNSKITGVSYLPNEKFETMGAHPRP